MVDLHWKKKMPTCNSPRLSSKLTLSQIHQSIRNVEISPASDSCCDAYEHYLHLAELKKLWANSEFKDWENESILKPALQALEITFRLISIVLSDPRKYTNQLEWRHKLEALAMHQVELIGLLCEGDRDNTTPTISLDFPGGVVPRNDSSLEVWTLPNGEIFVSTGSQASLLPRLAAWRTSKEIAHKIQYSIECNMRNCPYTLGLGEPNFCAKPSLKYDQICKPAELYFLKNNLINMDNFENKTTYAIHQIFETWVYFSLRVLDRIESRIGLKDFVKASSDCWVLERTWRLLEEIDNLHMLMDPDDLVHLKSQLSISPSSKSEVFCFRSRELVEMTRRSKYVCYKVPDILGSKDHDFVIEFYRKKEEPERIHLLQAMQGIESGLKRFYYSYKQLVVSVVGSVEEKQLEYADFGDSLSQIFLEPPYFPSLGAAKASLGDYWSGKKGETVTKK